MQTIFAYNFDLDDIADGDYHALYTTRRRDAVFAFAFEETGGAIILGRDHLGTIPLFYRVSSGVVKSSPFLHELLEPSDTIDEEGLRTYLAIGTVKLLPLFKNIHIVPPGSVVRVHPSGTTDVLYEYRIRPRRLGGWSFQRCVEEANQLLLQAVKRVVREKEVGLYLSGGIDSALIGIYLKQLGVGVHAYTSAPWGETSAEARAARTNVGIIGARSHALVPLNTANYSSYLNHSLEHYTNPNGAFSQLAIVSILEETDIQKLRQVFSGQNSDTVTCSVPAQSLMFFMSFVPSFFGRYLHPALKAHSVIDRYVSFMTSDMVKHYPPLERFKKGYSTLQQLTLAGMLFGHTPVDGEILFLQSLRGGAIPSNPYYDMDVVEFLLGLPLRHRLTWTRESRIRVALGKRVLRAVAARYLPKDIVQNKKGLSIPTAHDPHSISFFNSLPTHMRGLTLKTLGQRFSAAVLQQWMKKHGLSLS